MANVIKLSSLSGLYVKISGNVWRFATSGVYHSLTKTNIPKTLKEKNVNKKEKDTHLRILIKPKPRHWCKRMLADSFILNSAID